jgi:uncharacterized protein
MTANDNKRLAEQPRPGESGRRCPICGKPRSAAHDPFCSKRCADVDLHRWLKGSYVIPGDHAKGERSDDEDE